MIASYRTLNSPYVWGEYQNAIITITKVVETYMSQSDAPWGRPEKEIDFEGYIMYSKPIDVNDLYGGRKFSQPIIKKIIVNDRALSSIYALKIDAVPPIDLLKIAKDHSIKIQKGIIDKRKPRSSDLD